MFLSNLKMPLAFTFLFWSNKIQASASIALENKWETVFIILATCILLIQLRSTFY